MRGMGICKSEFVDCASTAVEAWSAAKHGETTTVVLSEVEVASLTSDRVDRAALLTLRRQCFGRDDWSATDDVALHLAAYVAGHLVGYYRVLVWSAARGDLTTLSPVCDVYRPDWEVASRYGILEFGRFCIQPGYRGRIRVTRGLWQALNE